MTKISSPTLIPITPEKSFRQASEVLSALPSVDFFSHAAESLAKAVGARYVMITGCCDSPATRLKTLAFWDENHFRDEYEYSLENTPCEQVINGDICVYPEKVQELFPDDQDLVDLGVVSYVAAPIYNSLNRVIGHIAVMDTEKLVEEEWTTHLMTIYAGRSGIELEKIQAEEKIDILTQGYRIPLGQDFFKQLVEIMGKAFDVDFAIAGKLSAPEERTIDTLAIYNRGTFLDPMHYSLENSPCETVVGKKAEAYPSEIQSVFPGFPLLAELGAEGYIGSPLFDSQGKSIGLLVLISKSIINNAEKILTILESFANRASYELERQIHEEYLDYYEEILSSSDDLMALIGLDYTYKAVNQSYCDSHNKKREEILNTTLREFHGEDRFNNILKGIIDRVFKGESVRAEIWREFPDGTMHCIQGQHNPYIDSNNNISGAIVVARDITELKMAQNAVADSEQRLHSLYNDTPAVFLTIDKDGSIVSVNEFGASELGYQIEELIGKNVSILSRVKDKPLLASYYSDCFDNPDEVQEWEVRRLHKNGKIIWVKETARVVTNANQETQLFIVSEDISEKHQLSQKLSYQASHDALTDLINRSEFERRLDKLLTSARADNNEHALCYLDLDQFKIVNDSYGHLAGDVLLKNIAELLRQKVRKGDALARLGGDEFGILMDNCSLDQATRIANSIRQSVQDYQFVWESEKYSLGVSIGLVPINSETDSIITIMSKVDAACYAAKDSGRNRVHIYNEDDEGISRRRGEMGWVQGIKDAISKNQFTLYSQKIVDLSSEDLPTSMQELLIRINRNGELIMPETFLSAAEHYDMSTVIDEWVVGKAFKWLIQNGNNQENTLCNINLSGLSLAKEEFLHYVLDCFDQYDISGRRICFEITETAAIANLGGATRFMKELGQHGCLFALDDFGSGVSSFGYLKNLPVDYVKIDGSFVRDMINDPIDAAMVQSINDIAHVMEKKTIAECVENTDTLTALRDIGVDYAQGFGIDKSAPVDLNEI